MATERLIPASWFRAKSWSRPIAAGNRNTVIRAAGEGERQLGRFVIPPFQRAPVWTDAQKVRLIESIWLGLPIGSYVVNMCAFNETDGWLLDGQQRWTAITEYMNGDFKVFGYLFTDLGKPERMTFQMTPIGEMETNLDTRAACEEVYDRLAYGGTAHAPKGTRK